MSTEAGLVGALGEMRQLAAGAAFPLALPSAQAAETEAVALVAQLDDYVVPRLRRLDAPLLAVVGGSTGSGKSTLVNSLVRAPISESGVLRPTTRAPVLVCHPADGAWFGERALLPGFNRTARPASQSLQVVSAPALHPGLALLDAPDIDSVVDDNRRLAQTVLDAADLWLFVTTAVRYADAVPWRLLREAGERGTAVCIVLDRVPTAAREEIAEHFGGMLSQHGLDQLPVFVIAESTLDGHGLVSELEVAPVKRWLDRVAGNPHRRREVVSRAVRGAIETVAARADRLSRAADEQVAVSTRMRDAVKDAFDAALSEVETNLRAGVALRGEVFARWQDLVDSGELGLSLRVQRISRRRQINAVRGDRPAPGQEFQAAVAAALVALVVDADATATRACRTAWRKEPPGRVLLAADPTLGRPWAGFADAVYNLVHEWQAWLRHLVRTESGRVRSRGRSYVTAAEVLLDTVAAIAPSDQELTASGEAARLLREVSEHRRSVEVGERARVEFLTLVRALLAAEVQRHLEPVASVPVEPDLGARLRLAADRLRATSLTGEAAADVA